MQSKTEWMLLALGALLLGCDSGTVGANTDAAVDGVVTTIRLDAPVAGDASSQDSPVAGDAGQIACHQEDGACATSVDFCCEGYACGTTNLLPTPHCMKICAQHAECSTGCCAALGDSGITVCLPQLFCPDIFCRAEEQSCGSDDPCCDGLVCAVLGTTPQTKLCKKVCTQHGECPTGCCAPLGTSGIRACLPQSYCPTVFCRTEEQSCLNEDPCCEGLVCAVLQTVPPSSACKPICEQHGDCATNCCVPLGTDVPSACLDKTYCGGG